MLEPPGLADLWHSPLQHCVAKIQFMKVTEGAAFCPVTQINRPLQTPLSCKLWWGVVHPHYFNMAVGSSHPFFGICTMNSALPSLSSLSNWHTVSELQWTMHGRHWAGNCGTELPAAAMLHPRNYSAAISPHLLCYGLKEYVFKRRSTYHEKKKLRNKDWIQVWKLERKKQTNPYFLNALGERITITHVQRYYCLSTACSTAHSS